MSDMEATPPDQATIPWHRVKQMLKRAWDESHEATCEARDQWGGLNYTPPNPYQED